MANRYCEMCDTLVKGKECPLCGADTRSLLPHAFHVDRHDAQRVRYGQEDIDHCATCGQAENRPIHRG